MSVSVAEAVQLGLLVPCVSLAVTVVLGKAIELLVVGPGVTRRGVRGWHCPWQWERKCCL